MSSSADRLAAGVLGFDGWVWDAREGRTGRSARAYVWRLADGRWAWRCSLHNDPFARTEPSRQEAMAASKRCLDCAREKAEAGA